MASHSLQFLLRGHPRWHLWNLWHPRKHPFFIDTESCSIPTFFHHRQRDVSVRPSRHLLKHPWHLWKPFRHLFVSLSLESLLPQFGSNSILRPGTASIPSIPSIRSIFVAGSYGGGSVFFFGFESSSFILVFFGFHYLKCVFHSMFDKTKRKTRKERER